MKPIYDATELDNIIKACLEFKKIAPQDHFYVGNIGGRKNVPPSTDGMLLKKMKYISGLDIAVLEYLGLGKNDIQYFEIGPRAKKFLSEGGFKNYYEQLKKEALLKDLSKWLPILISLIALIVATLTWLYPVNSEDKIEKLEHRIEQLEQKVK